jgi:hypothetical protein
MKGVFFMKGKIGTKVSVKYGVYGTALYNPRIMNRIISANKFSDSQTAQYRLKILNFHKEYGIQTAIAAYGISKATVYRWQARFKRSQGNASPSPGRQVHQGLTGKTPKDW